MIFNGFYRAFAESYCSAHERIMSRFVSGVFKAPLYYHPIIPMVSIFDDLQSRSVAGE